MAKKLTNTDLAKQGCKLNQFPAHVKNVTIKTRSTTIISRTRNQHVKSSVENMRWVKMVSCKLMTFSKMKQMIILLWIKPYLHLSSYQSFSRRRF